MHAISKHKNIILKLPHTKLAGILASTLQMSTELNYNIITFLRVESMRARINEIYNTNRQSPRSHSFSSSKLNSPGLVRIVGNLGMVYTPSLRKLLCYEERKLLCYEERKLLCYEERKLLCYEERGDVVGLRGRWLV